MQPIVDGIQQDFGDSLTVVRLDFTDTVNRDFLDEARVRSHPTFVVFSAAGEVFTTIVGATASETLRSAITAAIESHEDQPPDP